MRWQNDGFLLADRVKKPKRQKIDMFRCSFVKTIESDFGLIF
jgi:hypothetical protein